MASLNEMQCKDGWWVALATVVLQLNSSQANISFPGERDALVAAGLRDQMLLPGDAGYESRIESCWSASSQLRSFCIVQPRTKHDLAVTVRTLAACGRGEFAVRSGGHSHWAGGSNINNGVTIDLIHFKTISYDPALKMASLGPAQRWGDVYKALEPEGVMVAGGRDGDVGVGGLLTGGGNSYYAGRKGFACDNVVNAEVVLADGTIVEANANVNKDLWKALKGGLSNFGIVTRFDVHAFAAPQLWGGLRASSASHADALIDALVNFTDDNHKHPEAAFIINFTYQPGLSPGIIVAHVIIDVDGVQNAPVFDEVQRIPAFFSDIKTRPMSGVANDYILPSGLR